jgi:hypothetical protein
MIPLKLVETRQDVFALRDGQTHYHYMQKVGRGLHEGEITDLDVREIVAPVRRFARMENGTMRTYYYAFLDPLLDEAWESNADDREKMYEQLRHLYRSIYCQSFWGRLKYLFTDHLKEPK